MVKMSAQGKLVIRRIGDEEAKKKVVAFLSSKSRNITPEDVTTKLRCLPVVLSTSIDAEIGSRVARYLQELGADAIFVPAATADDSLKKEPLVLSEMSLSPKKSLSAQEDLSPTPQIKNANPSSGNKTAIYALSLLALVAIIGTKRLFDHDEGGFGVTAICILLSPFLIAAAVTGLFAEKRRSRLMAKVLTSFTTLVILSSILFLAFCLTTAPSFGHMLLLLFFFLLMIKKKDRCTNQKSNDEDLSDHNSAR
jgi:hypothetical protein